MNKQIFSVKFINRTHFICDDYKKILPIEKLNDDYCDCFDGTDEFLTTACTNGKFLCKNKYYFSKFISTSKLNDDYCDCCDGSDEKTFNCSKKCLYYSNIKHKELSNYYKLLSNVFSKKKFKKRANYTQKLLNYLDRMNVTYNNVKKFQHEKYLLEKYIKNKAINNQVKNSIINIDEDDIEGIISFLKEIIKKYKSFLNQEIEKVTKLLKYKSLYDYFDQLPDINLNFDENKCFIKDTELKCTIKLGKHKVETINFGKVTYVFNNVAIFLDGYECDFYDNVKYTAEIKFVCDKTEKFELIKNDNHCHYSFLYHSLNGCNGQDIQNNIDEILMILSNNKD